MNWRRPAGHSPRFHVLRCLICLPVLLLLAGCAGEREKTVHVFVGEQPHRGAAQIATNKKIAIISVDDKGAAHLEERDCGQMIVLQPWTYDELLRRANAAEAGR